MTDEILQNLIRDLNDAARGASVAEETFRREAAERIATLGRARAFAFRRLNLVKAIVAAMATAEDHPAAMAHATAAFLREVNWSGASESQREVVEKFLPVANAIWDARQAGESDEGKGESEGAAAVEQQLAAFEQWFERNRNGPFLSLMDGEALELPLVEVA
jgi:hypothetical protein